MSEAARPWLPANAVRDTTLSNLVAERARAWAARWFTEPKTVSVRMSEGGSRVLIPADAACWEASGDGDFLLSAGEPARMTIAGWMLGVTTGTQKFSSADRRLFCDLASAAALDLLRTLAHAFQLEAKIRSANAARPSGQGFRFTFSIGSATHLLELQVAEHLAVAARRAAVPASPSSSALGERSDAIARQRVRVGAMIGGARIRLSELSALARGDVLVLDRGSADTVDITINGQAKGGADYHLVQDGAALTLRHTRLKSSGQHLSAGQR